MASPNIAYKLQRTCPHDTIATSWLAVIIVTYSPMVLRSPGAEDAIVSGNPAEAA